MSHGMRPDPAARLVLLSLGLLLASATFPGPCLGGHPPLPDRRLGIKTAPLWLLSRADIRADVGLDETQAAEAERVLDELLLQASALKGKVGPEVDAGRRAINEAEEEWLKTRLSDAQRKRLIEIDLQWEGASALVSRPIVADHIGLTLEQRASLTRAIAERNRRRAQGDDLRESEYQLFQHARTLLTPEQLKRWKAMLGRSFTLGLAGPPPPAPRSEARTPLKAGAD
jgi:hypothetical protein